MICARGAEQSERRSAPVGVVFVWPMAGSDAW